MYQQKKIIYQQK